MIAYIPALLFAAIVAARASSNANTIVPRSALSSMTIKEADQICEPHQRLVCCDETEECSEVDIGRKYSVRPTKTSCESWWGTGVMTRRNRD